MEDPLNLDLLEALDDAQAEIDQLLDPLQSPNLDPVDAGDVERIWPPTTLAEFASRTLDLANEAHAAATSLSQPLRDEVVGSKIKTIESLMPGYYAAGGF